MGPRWDSVFLMEPQAVWKQEDTWYDDSGEQANQRCKQLFGHGLPRQTWGLRVKLREATSVMPPASTRCTRFTPRCPSPP